MATRRRQAEREFYYRQLAGNFPQKRVDQLAREFYIKYLSAHGGAPTGAQAIPLEQLELVWLKQFIITNGGTPTLETGGHPVGFRSSLWRQALIASGHGALVSKNLNDNRLAFYLNN